VDHAWIAGGDPDSLRAQRLYQERVLAAQSIDTNVFTAKQVKLLTDLYTELDFTSAIAKPIGDLLLVSHGNDSGWLTLDLDSAAGTSTDFAELHDILDPANVHRKTALRVPPTLYTTAANTIGPTRVILAGCRVGKAPKFVDAFVNLSCSRSDSASAFFWVSCAMRWKRIAFCLRASSRWRRARLMSCTQAAASYR